MGSSFLISPKTDIRELALAELAIDTETGRVIKWRGGPIDPNAMDPKEHIYSIHWETEKDFPRWQLSDNGCLRVDITREFDARYRLIAYRYLLDEEKERLIADLHKSKATKRGLQRLEPGICEPTGRGGYRGYDDRIFKHTESHKKASYFWKVTNCARMLPGFAESIASGGTFTKFDPKRHLARHPDDGYQVQFCGVPFGVFGRYWRRAIHLDGRFHNGRKGYGWVMRGRAIDVLDFDFTLLKQHKCFFADFSPMANPDKKRKHDGGIEEWMIKYARAFRFMSDHESPFVKADAEVFFTLEWMQ